MTVKAVDTTTIDCYDHGGGVWRSYEPGAQTTLFAPALSVVGSNESGIATIDASSSIGHTGIQLQLREVLPTPGAFADVSASPLAVGTTSHTESSLVNGRTYAMQARTTDGTNDSPWSPERQFTPLLPVVSEVPLLTDATIADIAASVADSRVATKWTELGSTITGTIAQWGYGFDVPQQLLMASALYIVCYDDTNSVINDFVKHFYIGAGRIDLLSRYLYAGGGARDAFRGYAGDHHLAYAILRDHPGLNMFDAGEQTIVEDEIIALYYDWADHVDTNVFDNDEGNAHYSWLQIITALLPASANRDIIQANLLRYAPKVSLNWTRNKNLAQYDGGDFNGQRPGGEPEVGYYRGGWALGEATGYLDGNLRLYINMLLGSIQLGLGVENAQEVILEIARWNVYAHIIPEVRPTVPMGVIHYNDVGGGSPYQHVHLGLSVIEAPLIGCKGFEEHQVTQWLYNTYVSREGQPATTFAYGAHHLHYLWGVTQGDAGPADPETLGWSSLHQCSHGYIFRSSVLGKASQYIVMSAGPFNMSDHTSQGYEESFYRGEATMPSGHHAGAGTGGNRYNRGLIENNSPIAIDAVGPYDIGAQYYGSVFNPGSTNGASAGARALGGWGAPMGVETWAAYGLQDKDQWNGRVGYGGAFDYPAAEKYRLYCNVTEDGATTNIIYTRQSIAAGFAGRRHQFVRGFQVLPTASGDWLKQDLGPSNEIDSIYQVYMSPTPWVAADRIPLLINENTDPLYGTFMQNKGYHDRFIETQNDVDLIEVQIDGDGGFVAPTITDITVNSGSVLGLMVEEVIGAGERCFLFNQKCPSGETSDTPQENWNVTLPISPTGVDLYIVGWDASQQFAVANPSGNVVTVTAVGTGTVPLTTDPGDEIGVYKVTL